MPSSPIPDVSAPAIDFFTRAEELYDQGEFETAITCYRRGLEKDPGNIVAINNLAMVFIEKERYEDARNELERAIAGGANDAEILSNLGYVLRKLGKDRDAAEVYDKYLQMNPGAEDAEPIRNWIAKVRSQAEEAETPAPAPEPAPETPAPEPEEAPEPVIAQPVDAPPPLASASEPAPPAPPQEPSSGPSEQELDFLEQADLAYEEERFEDAIALYDKALEVNVDSIPALSGRGRAQAKAGLLEEGLATLREAAQLNPDDPDNWYVIGFILRTLERDREAADAYEKFLALAPDAGNAGKIRGWINEVNEREAQSSAPADPEPAPQPEPAAPAETSGSEEPAWAQSLEGNAEEPEEEAHAPAPPEQAPEAKAPSFAVGSAEVNKPAGEETLESKLERVQMLLREGDTATALTTAQEIVGQNPNLTSAKILIARCFGQRGEFNKALAILKNVVANEDNDEALFFLGRCHQELGNTREAKRAFEQCKEITNDPELKDRLDELIGRSGGDKGICSTCGNTVPVQELETVDGQQQCTQCRSNREQSMRAAGPAVAASVAAEKSAPKARPRVKRRRRGGLLLPILMIILFSPAAILVGGIAGFSFALSDFITEAQSVYEVYAEAENPTPKTGGGIARIPKTDPQTSGDTGTTDPSGGDTTPPSALEQFVIDSPPLTELVVGSEYTHKIHASGAPGENISYGVAFSRTPATPHQFDQARGVLTWKPTPQDMAAGPITITFTAESGGSKALEQKCQVTFRAPVTSRLLGPVAPVLPGESVCLSAGQVGGDERADVVVARGAYHEGELILYLASERGLSEAARMKLPGRPIAVGIGNFGIDGAQIMVVDYWNAEAFFVRYDGELVRTAESLAFPDRPTLAAIGNPDGEGPLGLAVVCPAVRSLLVYDALAGTKIALFKRLDLPMETAWKDLHIADLYKESPDGIYREIALVRLGTRQPNLFVTGVEEGSSWTKLSVGTGVVQASASGDVVGKPQPALEDIAIVTGARDSVLHAFPGQAKGETSLSRRTPLPTDNFVLAMQAADLDGNGTKDMVFLFRDQVLYRLRSLQGEAMRLGTVTVEGKTAPPLRVSAVADVTGDRIDDVIYIERGGALRLVTSPSAE